VSQKKKFSFEFVKMSVCLRYNSLSNKVKRELKSTLTAKPLQTQYDQNPGKRKCYEVDRKNDVMYIPLSQWKALWGEFPSSRDEYPKTKIKFNSQLYTKETDPKGRGRDQDVVFKEAVSKSKEKHCCFIACPTGYGKCLAPGTEVLMFDGTKKVVEDIAEGELIMGDDSTPRKILSTCEGEEEMFDIIPAKGESFAVNKSHILTLRASAQGSISKRQDRKLKNVVTWFDGARLETKGFEKYEDASEFSVMIKKKAGDVFDVELKDYLKFPKNVKHVLKCFWARADYPKQEVSVDPYFVGMWLGDDSPGRPSAASADLEIINYVGDLAAKINMRIAISEADGVKTLKLVGNVGRGDSRRNFLLSEMKALILTRDKHIPLIYKSNSRDARMKLLAGLVDAGGYVGKNCCEITQKSKKLAEDIRDLCRSLGFACFIAERRKSCAREGEEKGGIYYRVLFYGEGAEDIPVLLERKKSGARRQAKNPLATGFTVKSRGKGGYCGFTIDGNGRFLLGSYMVTHNTVLGICLAAYFKLKTAVICHSDIIKEQWKEAFEDLAGAKVQIVKGKKPLDPAADAYIIGVQKSSTIQREWLEKIGFVIVDEAHICTETAFTASLLRFQLMYVAGFSATPDRNDGLHKLLYMYFGPLNDFICRSETKSFTVTKYKTGYRPKINYRMVMGKMTLDWNLVVSSLAEDEDRQREIVRIAIKHPEEKIIILSSLTVQSRGIYDKLVDAGESVELLIGSKKKWDKTKRILVAGTKKGGVGLNDPSLTMLIMASSTKDVRQFEGRIRTTDNLIYDIVDDNKTLEKHWELREDWYVERGATIVHEGVTSANSDTQFSKHSKGSLPLERFSGRK